MQLDINFVRNQFSQLDDDPNFVFCSNAGGSYVSNQVQAVMEHYNRHTRVQPYERYRTSAEAGKAMDRAIHGWANVLNITPAELTIAPSTSINTYVMANAIGYSLKSGDEIIVTNQDHEANSGVWRRKAEERGIVCKEWRVDPLSGLLDTESLYELVTENTKWVFFTHCSNIVGTSNPVQTITSEIKKRSNAKVFVDAVAYAPHHISDLKALDVDGYVFSLYKVFGPHQSLMYVKKETHEELTPQCHYFNHGYSDKLLNPAGPQHSQVASCAGVLDYFDDLYDHHFDDGTLSASQKMGELYALISQHEDTLGAPLLDYLSNSKKVRLIGKAHTKDQDRAPTIAFAPIEQSASQVATKMQDQGIGTESGDFYAHRLISDLGINPNDGVVRISLVHYGTDQDVEKILLALDQALN
ncbi:MAG: aminotransferase class V-fold PLP-dependent enzyme [Gammaproteobacteria bacterium]|nr:aminotransferase class V-fold PLP-dependent enzyme [Gammaproteobacteria bacterium]